MKGVKLFISIIYKRGQELSLIIKINTSVSDPVSFRPDPDPGSRIRIPDLDIPEFVNQFRWNVRLSCVDS